MKLKGKVVRGHQVALGLAKNCPWPGGSVALQLPLMAQYGMPVADLYAGTLNVALYTDEVPYPLHYDFDFVIDWRAPDKPTHFRIHKLVIEFNDCEIQGWAYRKIYPEGYVSLHPQPSNVIEILAPKIVGIQYGDEVTVRFVKYD